MRKCLAHLHFAEQRRKLVDPVHRHRAENQVEGPIGKRHLGFFVGNHQIRPASLAAINRNVFVSVKHFVA